MFHKTVKFHPQGRHITTGKILNVDLSSFTVLVFPGSVMLRGSELLLGTYSVLGAEASAVHHQELNHLKSVDSHSVVHWCVSILDRTLAEVTTQSFLNNIAIIILMW